MIAVIQRVAHSLVKVEGKIIGEIAAGLNILLGIEDADNDDDISWLVRKVANLRIFDDEDGVMNKSVVDVGGDILVISQFTLHASTKKGNRPSYIKAAKPDHAIPMYEKFVNHLEVEIGKPVATGEFGANMQVDILNDGPVTILIDTKDRK